MKSPTTKTDALTPSFRRELAAHGLRIVDSAGPVVACAACGTTFTIPAALLGKTRPAGYWHCPRGCNFQSRKTPPTQ